MSNNKVKKFRKSSVFNKQVIIEMAGNNESRPSRKTKLGMSLVNYIAKSGVCYDPVFTAELKALAPHWFRSSGSLAIPTEPVVSDTEVSDTEVSDAEVSDTNEQ